MGTLGPKEHGGPETKRTWGPLDQKIMVTLGPKGHRDPGTKDQEDRP